jgi:hypothetical protein
MIDEDEAQEYQCLLLEGYDPKTARKLARSANDKVNSKRISGPTTGDTRNGHGLRPLVTDFNAEATSGVYQDAVPLTLDSRSDMERESDWDRSDYARECFSLLTQRQQDIVGDYLGLTTGSPMSAKAVAERYGISHTTIRNCVLKAAKRIRRVANVTEMGVANLH